MHEYIIQINKDMSHCNYDVKNTNEVISKFMYTRNI